MPWVALGPQSESVSRWSFKICSFEYPRAVVKWVQRIDLASFCSELQSSWRDADECCCVAQVKPGLNAIVGRPMHRDPVLRAERGHLLADPSIAVACLNAVAIEQTRYDIVLGDKGKLVNRLNDVDWRAVALPATASRQTVFGMHPAHPVDRDNDLAGRIVEIGNGLPDHCPHDTLLQASVGCWRGPNSFKVLGKCGEADRFGVDTGQGGSVVIGDALFDRLDMSECAIPARLQFTGDQAVLRVGDIVLAERPIGSEPRCLKITSQSFTHLITLCASLCLSRQRRLGGDGLDDRKQSLLNDIINTQPTEADASLLLMVEAPCDANVAGNAALRAAIVNRQLLTATPAA